MSVDAPASLDGRRHQQGAHLVGASLAISRQAFFTPFGVWARFVAFTPELMEPGPFHQGNFASAVTARRSTAYLV